MRGFVDKKLYIERLIYYPTLRCNLKCALCCAYSPYYENPYYPTMEHLCEELDKLFSAADFVEQLEVVGGEPLIRRDINVLLQKLRQYASRIGKIRLTTNGTILPGEEFIKEAKALGDRFFVLIDDYGPELSKKAEELYEVLKRADVPAEIRDNYKDIYGGGWWDLGTISLLWNENEAKALYNRCIIGKNLRTMNYIDGKVYQCATHRRAVELGVVPADAAEVIDLFDPSATRDELRARLAAVYNLEVLSACKHCPGRLKEAKRYKPGVQIGGE